MLRLAFGKVERQTKPPMNKIPMRAAHGDDAPSHALPMAPVSMPGDIAARLDEPEAVAGAQALPVVSAGQ